MGVNKVIVEKNFNKISKPSATSQYTPEGVSKSGVNPEFLLEEKKQLITSLNTYKKEINYYYNYPVEDLISWLLLEDRRLYLKKDVSGKFYYLNFYSPPETWQDLCGVSGIYLIDSRTLKALFFEELIIN